MKLTETERVTILMMRGYGLNKIRSYQEVVTLFNETYPERNPISKSTVYCTVERFHRTGSIKEKPRTGRPTISTNDEKVLQVLLTVTENEHNSVRKIAQETDISKSSAHQILKRHKYHPYKMKLVQELSDDDFNRRMEFCDETMRKYDVNNQFFFWNCFSDESSFELSGSINRHNMRYWRYHIGREIVIHSILKS